MIVSSSAAPFWPAPPSPQPSADPAALAALARLVGTAPATAVPEPRAGTAASTGHGEVRAGGRIVGLLLPFGPGSDGPVYAPVRGPARIRELVEDGIIA
jgi:hypothetical protein